MGTYKVTFDLGAGKTMSLLITASDEEWAISEAIGLLQSVGVNEDVLLFDANGRARNVDARMVSIRRIFLAA